MTLADIVYVVQSTCIHPGNANEESHSDRLKLMCSIISIKNKPEIILEKVAFPQANTNNSGFQYTEETTFSPTFQGNNVI